MDQRTAQAQLLLHAARELACRPAHERVEARRLEQFIDAAPALSFRLTKQPPVKIDVLKAAQRRIKVSAEALWHIGDTRRLRRAVRFVGHIAIENRDPALLNDADAGNQP